MTRTCTTVIGYLPTGPVDPETDAPIEARPIYCDLPAAYSVETHNIETGWAVIEFKCKGCAGSALTRRESGELRLALKLPE